VDGQTDGRGATLKEGPKGKMTEEENSPLYVPQPCKDASMTKRSELFV